MRAKLFGMASAQASRLFLIVLIPPAILAFLFGLQHAFGMLRYLNPIVRYVSIVGFAVAVFQILRTRVKTAWHLPFQPVALQAPTVFVAIFSLISALCLLVLMISWSNGGTLDYSATAGILPWSDARGYLHGAEQLLYDHHLTEFTERRPLNALFLAARLFLAGDNFFGALIIQALFASLALSLATNAVLQTHGKIAAVFFFVISFSFVGTCLQRTLSEPLGITLGLIAFALQWSGISNKSLVQYTAGTFVLALALFASAGAMFVLAASAVFAVLLFPGSWQWRLGKGILVLAAIAGVWLLNLAMIKLYGTGSKGALLSNFSYTLYGLSQGGVGWVKAITEARLATGGGDAEVSAFLYRKAIESVLTNPSLLIWGLSKSLVVSLASYPIHIFRLLADGSDGGSPSALGHVAFVAVIMTPAVFIGFLRTLKVQSRRLDPFHLYLLIFLAGFVASLPFFYLDGGVRLTAATFPVTAAMVALFLSTFAAPAEVTSVAQGNAVLSYSATAAIIVVSLCAPELNRLKSFGSTSVDKQCSTQEQQLKIRTGARQYRH